MFYFNVAILISFHMRKKRQLEAPYHEKEIWEVLKSMHPTKAQGSDGYHAKIFQTQWQTIGCAISKMLLKCLNEGNPISDLNETFITLIPKINDLVSLVD